MPTPDLGTFPTLNEVERHVCSVTSIYGYYTIKHGAEMDAALRLQELGRGHIITGVAGHSSVYRHGAFK